MALQPSKLAVMSAVSNAPRRSTQEEWLRPNSSESCGDDTFATRLLRKKNFHFSERISRGSPDLSCFRRRGHWACDVGTAIANETMGMFGRFALHSVRRATRMSARNPCHGGQDADGTSLAAWKHPQQLRGWPSPRVVLRSMGSDDEDDFWSPVGQSSSGRVPIRFVRSNGRIGAVRGNARQER